MPWIGVLVLPVASPFTVVQDHMLTNTKARLGGFGQEVEICRDLISILY